MLLLKMYMILRVTMCCVRQVYCCTVWWGEWDFRDLECTAASVTVTATASATVNNYDDVRQQIYAVVKSASSCTKTPFCLIQFQLYASPRQFRRFNTLCLSVCLFYSYCYREAFCDVSYRLYCHIACLVQTETNDTLQASIRTPIFYNIYCP